MGVKLIGIVQVTPTFIPSLLKLIREIVLIIATLINIVVGQTHGGPEFIDGDTAETVLSIWEVSMVS